MYAYPSDNHLHKPTNLKWQRALVKCTQFQATLNIVPNKVQPGNCRLLESLKLLEKGPVLKSFTVIWISSLWLLSLIVVPYGTGNLYIYISYNCTCNWKLSDYLWRKPQNSFQIYLVARQADRQSMFWVNHRAAARHLPTSLVTFTVKTSNLTERLEKPIVHENR